MGVVLKNDVIVIKSFNNNVVLVHDDGKEKILFDKGIGFGKKPGQYIAKGSSIQKVFIISQEENKRNFKELINRVEDDFIGVFEEALKEIELDLDEELDEKIHIGLIEHLTFAIKRLKNSQEIQNPFLIEVETLYKKEFELACKLAEKIGKHVNIGIPYGEIGFIALHIHSARNNGKLSNTVKYAFLSNSIVEEVEESLNIEIDRQSLDYARFLTHIRFTIERIMNNKSIQNTLVDVIQKKFEESYKISENVAEIISEELDKPVSEDEIAYLAMHIERFKISIEAKSN
ncbi:glucose PTS transporter transcription antiterminator GlcT [Clostridium septicum]|uniref:PRD domain-containing protein n=1 Tax=Clostridium septicum TaxID=1504 RepID=A0A9N7JMX7_CLOSE|nr:PRD domain-containing protein [Clostridium septicum]AYE34910.1 transcription antiterminator BglG [Clostridium septicum]MDU1313871.1 PRD domain-containing protein [Clostridium septicum]QAS60304.1 PRD domain-containing protein [Clostridium septicum]UEC20441.1 PRD domain-containing protein [Clostridium septicum]USS01502.1 PRD domain-containing protein [Clostridium septicum]